MRRDQAEIDISLIQEAMDKRKLGLPSTRLPPSKAKTRMATVQVCCPLGVVFEPVPANEFLQPAASRIVSGSL